MGNSAVELYQERKPENQPGLNDAFAENVSREILRLEHEQPGVFAEAGAESLDQIERERTRQGSDNVLKKAGDVFKNNQGMILGGAALVAVAVGVFFAMRHIKKIAGDMINKVKETAKAHGKKILIAALGGTAVFTVVQKFLKKDDIETLFEGGGKEALVQRMLERLKEEDAAAEYLALIDQPTHEQIVSALGAEGKLPPFEMLGKVGEAKKWAETKLSGLGTSASGAALAAAITAKPEDTEDSGLVANITTRVDDGETSESEEGVDSAEVDGGVELTPEEIEAGYITPKIFVQKADEVAHEAVAGTAQYGSDWNYALSTVLLIPAVHQNLPEGLWKAIKFGKGAAGIAVRGSFAMLKKLIPRSWEMATVEFVAIVALYEILTAERFQNAKIPTTPEAFRQWVKAQPDIDPEKQKILIDQADAIHEFIAGERSIWEILNQKASDVGNILWLNAKEVLDKSPEDKIRCANIRGIGRLAHELGTIGAPKDRAEGTPIREAITYLEEQMKRMKDHHEAYILGPDVFEQIAQKVEQATAHLDPNPGFTFVHHDGYLLYHFVDQEGNTRTNRLGLDAELDVAEQVEKAEAFYLYESHFVGIALHQAQVVMRNAVEGGTETIEKLVTTNPVIVINGLAYVHDGMKGYIEVPLGFVKGFLWNEDSSPFVAEALDDYGKAIGGLFIIGMTKDLVVAGKNLLLSGAAKQGGGMARAAGSIFASPLTRAFKSTTAPARYTWQGITAVFRWRAKIHSVANEVAAFGAYAKKWLPRQAGSKNAAAAVDTINDVRGHFEKIGQMRRFRAQMLAFQGEHIVWQSTKLTKLTSKLKDVASVPELDDMIRNLRTDNFKETLKKLSLMIENEKIRANANLRELKLIKAGKSVAGLRVVTGFHEAARGGASMFHAGNVDDVADDAMNINKALQSIRAAEPGERAAKLNELIKQLDEIDGTGSKDGAKFRNVMRTLRKSLGGAYKEGVRSTLGGVQKEVDNFLASDALKALKLETAPANSRAGRLWSAIRLLKTKPTDANIKAVLDGIDEIFASDKMAKKLKERIGALAKTNNASAWDDLGKHIDDVTKMNGAVDDAATGFGRLKNLFNIRRWLLADSGESVAKVDQLMAKLNSNPAALKCVTKLWQWGIPGFAAVMVVHEALREDKQHKETAMMHITIVGVLRAAQLGFKTPAPHIVGKLAVAAVGALAALIGINQLELEQYIEEKAFGGGEFVDAGWVATYKVLMKSNEYMVTKMITEQLAKGAIRRKMIEERLKTEGKKRSIKKIGEKALEKQMTRKAVEKHIDRQIAKKMGKETTRGALKEVFKSKLKATAGKEFIKVFIKRMGVRAAVMIGGKAAVAGGVAVIPVAGWIVSAGLLAWTAWDGYALYRMIDKAKRMNDAFDAQLEDDIVKVENVAPETEKQLREQVDADAGAIGTYDAVRTAMKRGTGPEKEEAKAQWHQWLQEYMDQLAYFEATFVRDSGTDSYIYRSGNPQEVTIKRNGETHHLSQEDLAAANDMEPPMDFHPEEPPLEANDPGWEQWCGLQAIKLKSATDWSQIHIAEIKGNADEIVIKRHDLDRKKTKGKTVHFTMSRKGKKWDLVGNIGTKKIPMGEGYGFHAAVAQANICMDSVEFLLAKKKEGDTSWRFGDDEETAFRANDEGAIVFDKDSVWGDREIYSAKWMKFYNDKFDIDSGEMAANLELFLRGGPNPNGRKRIEGVGKTLGLV